MNMVYAASATYCLRITHFFAASKSCSLAGLPNRDVPLEAIFVGQTYISKCPVAPRNIISEFGPSSFPQFVLRIKWFAATSR